MSELLRRRDPATLTPYEAVLRNFGYLARLDATGHGLVRDAIAGLQTADEAFARFPLGSDGLGVAGRAGDDHCMRIPIDAVPAATAIGLPSERWSRNLREVLSRSMTARRHSPLECVFPDMRPEQTRL